jgi:hypothetical protein
VSVAHSCESTPRRRLIDVRDNLIARIAEAEREGWMGEAEGLRVSFAGAKDKLTQIDNAIQRRNTAIELGIPSYRELARRTTAVSNAAATQ